MVALLVAAVVVLAACSGAPAPRSADGAGSEPGEVASEAAWPEGLTAYVDQSRQQRVTRVAFVRLVNDAEREITAIRAEVTSPRFETVTWEGEARFRNENDLEFELPQGRCGEGTDATLRLTYRIDDGPLRVSTTTATDRYGAVEQLLARDCAHEVLAEAATLSLGSPRVVGEGRRSVFELPVTLTPTGQREDVSFAGFGDTVLFRHAPASAAYGAAAPVPLAAEPVSVRVRLVPTRCDPHALAEDKIGTLIPVHVTAPELPEGSHFHLPIGDERRTALRAFFGPHCGL